MIQDTLQAPQQADDFSHAIFIFELFQKGMIFTAIVAGIICCGHLVFVRRKYCRNTTTLMAVVLSGFLHLIACVCMLKIAEKNTEILVKQRPPSVGSCLDNWMTARCANTMVLVVVIRNVFVQNFKWSLSSFLPYAGILGCIITGSVFVIKRVPKNSSLPVAQHSLVTLGTSGSQHVNVFLSVCQKNVYEERWAILAEYFLIYVPVIVTSFAALCMNRTKQSDVTITELTIISNRECNIVRANCNCVKLNSVMIAILSYFTLVILFVNPGYILFAAATSGFFWDIWPSFLQIVFYTSFCSDYIGKIVQNTNNDFGHLTWFLGVGRQEPIGRQKANQDLTMVQNLEHTVG